MARLIRTEKEVEGRREEVWLVVDEDALEQWPAGPLEVVGRPAPRIDGLARARGEALYTADIQLPGMLHTAVLRSPHAHARVTRIDLAPALAAPGVRAAIGPGDIAELSDECGYEGVAGRGRLRRHARAGRAPRSRSSTSSGRCSSRCSTPTRRSPRRDPRSTPRTHERGDLERGLAEADVVVEATYRTQTVLHNSMETHQSVCRWVGDALEVYTSTQYIWGVRKEVAEALGLAGRQGARRLRVHGRRLRLEERPGDYTLHRRRAREAHGPPGPLRADAPRGERRRRQPQRDDPAARRSARAPTAR